MLYSFNSRFKNFLSFSLKIDALKNLIPIGFGDGSSSLRNFNSSLGHGKLNDKLYSYHLNSFENDSWQVSFALD